MIALYRMGFLAFLLFGWWVASLVGARGIIPSPFATGEAALRLFAEGRISRAVWESLTIFLSGYGLAVVIGIAVGLVMGAYRVVGRTLDIFVYALAATPRVAFIPLIIVLLGLGYEAKTFIVFLGAVMPIVINTYAGVLDTDEELVEMARSTGSSQRRIFTHIVLPGAVPFLIVGLRIGATIGLINTVVAELYTAVSGLGGQLAIYGNPFRMAEYFVIVLILAAFGVIVTELLRWLETRLSRWRVSNRT